MKGRTSSGTCRPNSLPSDRTKVTGKLLSGAGAGDAKAVAMALSSKEGNGAEDGEVNSKPPIGLMACVSTGSKCPATILCQNRHRRPHAAKEHSRAYLAGIRRGPETRPWVEPASRPGAMRCRRQKSTWPIHSCACSLKLRAGAERNTDRTRLIWPSAVVARTVAGGGGMATAWILRMATTPLAETCSTEIACSFAGRTLSTGSTTFNPSACTRSFVRHRPFFLSGLEVGKTLRAHDKSISERTIDRRKHTCSSSMPHSPRASHAPSSGGASTRMTVRSLLCPVTAYRCIPLCPTTPAQLSDTTPPAVEAGSTGAGALSGLCN
eukprot:3876476-Rhodomonas_salina.6